MENRAANRIIPENLCIVKDAKPLHDADSASDLDLSHWDKINALRIYLAKDHLSQLSLFTRIKEAVLAGNFDVASALQIEMADKVDELKVLYREYKKNMIHLS